MKEAAGTHLPYKPSADGQYRVRTTKETMPDHAFCYLVTYSLNCRIAAALANEVGDLGEGITLSFSRGKGKPIHVPLGEMTEEELTAARDFIADAFAAALPIVQAKDKAAKDAWHIDGDDSYFRQYRSAPVVAKRDRALAEYIEGCVERSAYVPLVERERVDQSAGDGDAGDDVPTGDASGEVASDNS